MLDATLEGTDLDFMRGATLIQVAIGENEVILRTDPAMSISIFSNVQVTLFDGATQVFEDASTVGTSFLSLLGKSLEQAVGTETGSLVLTWSDGSATEVQNTWDRYESYLVTYDDLVLVV